MDPSLFDKLSLQISNQEHCEYNCIYRTSRKYAYADREQYYEVSYDYKLLSWSSKKVETHGWAK